MPKLLLIALLLLLTAFLLIVPFLIFAAFSATSATSACNKQDLAALLALKGSFPANTLPNSWTPAVDCCSWEHVECAAATGRVTALSISDNKIIKGPFPPSVGDLSALQAIIFSDLPGLSGPLPPNLSKLTSLEFLAIYNTNLSGPVPSYLSAFPGLMVLSLSNNAFSGAIPASLGGLANLSTIDLSGNRLTGPIPGSLFGKLAPGLLADLDLSGNALTGPVPPSFGRVAFTNINLGGNQLTGDASFLLGKTKTVPQVILARNKLAFDLTNVRYPLKLQYLDISHNQIYGSVSSQITELKDFRYLNVSYNLLCGKIPSGGSFRRFGASFFANNKCLCGTPLPSCE